MRDYFLIGKDITKSNQPYLVDLELTDDELQAIGHVVAQWSLLDHTLKEYAEFLSELGKTPVPEDVYSYNNQKRKRALRALVDSVLSGHRNQPEASRIVSKASDMLGDRHDVIHGIFRWHKSDKHKLEIHSRKRPSAKLRTRVVDKDWLRRFAKKISALTVELMWVHGPGLVSFGEKRDPGKPVRV